MELTPRLLTEVEFREQWRGYSQNEVDDFLERVAAAVAELLERLREANERASTAERRLLERAEDDEIRRTLVLAQRTASTALEEAQAEAARIVGEAEDRRRDMEAEIAERTERELGDLLDRRRSLESDIASLTSFVEELRASVRSELQRQLDALDALAAPSTPPVSDVHVPEPPAASAMSRPVMHPPREAPLTAPRPPTDDEVAQAREDLVDALRRAGVDALFQEELSEPEATSGPQPDVEPAMPLFDDDEADEISGGDPTGAYDALADDDEEEGIAWADETPSDDDPFLAELRRAVTDTEPLGPRDHEPQPAPADDSPDDASGSRFRLRRGR
jgi:DivIVA domain-containing protein